MSGNEVQYSHVAESLDDVRDCIRQDGLGLEIENDTALIAALLDAAEDLKQADQLGDAEDAFIFAKRVARLAVLYMARGLA